MVISDIVSKVLCVPRVEHPDYPCCKRLRTMSKDKLISTFCECLSNWGDHQFISCMAFAKGPRFLNMVITFVLHPLSHYNSITEPRDSIFAFPFRTSLYRFSLSFHSFYHRCT